MGRRRDRFKKDIFFVEVRPRQYTLDSGFLTFDRWIKEAGFDAPNLDHLKRIKKPGPNGLPTLLLTDSPSPPTIPSDFPLSEVYQLDVPELVALTPASLKHKMKIWPTNYAPRRKGEPEPWTRAMVAWAWDAVEVLRKEAKKAIDAGEVKVLVLSLSKTILRLALASDSVLRSFSV